MDLTILILGAIFLSIAIWFYIHREKIFYSKKNINVKDIIPKGWKQILAFTIISGSLLVVVLMMNMFYKAELIYSLKRVLVIALLWPIAISDYQEYRVPNKLILCGLILRAVVLVFELFFKWDTVLLTVLNEGIAVIGVIVICVLCLLMSRGSIGMGDLKLMILLGFMLGIEGVCYSMFLSILFSFFVAVFLLATKKKKKKDAIPFAPFILSGTYLSIILSGI